MSPVDYDALNERVNERQGRGWQPDSGRNVIRILPPATKFVTEVATRISYKFRSHFIRVEGRDLAIFRCLRDYDESCPACQAFFEYREHKDPKVAEVFGGEGVMGNGFGNSERFLFNILDVEDADSGVQHFESGPMIYRGRRGNGGIMKYARNPQWGDPLDPGEEGRNYVINKDDGGRYTDYDVEPEPETSSVVHLLPNGWEENLDGLETAAPDRWSVDRIEKLVEDAKVICGLSSGSRPSSGGQTRSKSQPKQQSSGGSSTKQRPGYQQGDGDTAPSGTEESPQPSPDPDPEPDTSGGGDGPSSGSWEDGPEIGASDVDDDPETPVCYGDYDRRKQRHHPCENCGHETQCQMKSIGLGG